MTLDDQRSAELIILAQTVHTMDGGSARIEAVALRAGCIVGLGSRDEIAGYIGDDTEILDLGEATVVPGLVDAHMHPVMAIELLAGVDLRDAQTPNQVRELIVERAGTVAPGTWVRGWGLDPNMFDNGEATNGCLNNLPGGCSAFVQLFDAHSALANEAALQAAGITGSIHFDNGSRIVCDNAGRPTGLLLEIAAQMLVMDVIPPLPFEERKELLVASLRDMASTGLTGAHVLDMNQPDTVELLDAIEADSDLPIKLRLSPWCTPNFAKAKLPELRDLLGQRGRRWAVEGIKFMVDGTIDNGTAWLAEPDTNGESTSSLWLDPSQYSRSVEFFHRHAIPTATHAIGDAAIEHVIKTLQALPRTDSSPVHRVEHIETLPDFLVAPFAGKGIAASMQPNHCTHFSEADLSDNWSRRLGPERARNGYRTRDLRDAGATLAIGSDWPIAPYDPRLIIADAQLRRRAGHPEMTAIEPRQRLTALQALEGYTLHVAESIGCSTSGRIAVGAPADLTVFSADPLTTDPDDFAASTVLATVVDGVVVHLDDAVMPARAAIRGRVTTL